MRIYSYRKWGRSVPSDSATPWTVVGQAPPSMGFLSKHTGVGCHFLLQRIFLTQGSNPSLLHCRRKEIQNLSRTCKSNSPKISVGKVIRWFTKNLGTWFQSWLEFQYKPIVEAQIPMYIFKNNATRKAVKFSSHFCSEIT